MADIQQKIAFLGKFLTPRRKALIEEVLARRTDWLTIVLEDVYHAQNISAALRTAECLGVQDIHIIEQRHGYQVNPRIVKGSAKWLTLHHYRKQDHQDPAATCIDRLKASGYTIYATVPVDDEAVSLYDLDIDHKSAFVFGTEFSGISRSASQLADRLVSIPMHGFTESFNISVCVALVLQQARRQLQARVGSIGLTAGRQESLQYTWYRRSVQHADQLLKRFESS